MIKRFTQQLFTPATPRLKQFSAPEHATPMGDRLKLLSFNMQAGMGMDKSHHYVTRSWQHIFPHPQRHNHLKKIAELLSGYDIVGLQEVDGGSLRSGFIHQLHHLAELANFAFWHQQLNRDFGQFGQYSNGLLSRPLPLITEEYTLPGVKGRGAIISRYGERDDPLVVVNLHLALGQKTRAKQLEFINEIIRDERYVVVMGDLNCNIAELAKSPIGKRDWRWLDDNVPTYPSWRPTRQIDHILVSPDLQVASAGVIDTTLSDHKPLSLELILPAHLHAYKTESTTSTVLTQPD